MFYSDQKKQVSLYNRSTFILFLLKLSLFSAVGWRLYNIQILDSSKYKTMSKKNQIDLEIIFPIRGKIFDRNKVLIAKNEKVYDVYIIPENTKSINNTLNALSKFIDIDFIKRRKVIELSKQVKKFEKIKIFENISWSTLEKIGRINIIYKEYLLLKIIFVYTHIKIIFLIYLDILVSQISKN